MHTQQNNLFERKRYLELSRQYFKAYLHQCAALRILEDEDVFREDNDEVNYQNIALQNRTHEYSVVHLNYLAIKTHLKSDNMMY